jgi:hypothetical protein
MPGFGPVSTRQRRFVYNSQTATIPRTSDYYRLAGLEDHPTSASWSMAFPTPSRARLAELTCPARRRGKNRRAGLHSERASNGRDPSERVTAEVCSTCIASALINGPMCRASMLYAGFLNLSYRLAQFQ